MRHRAACARYFAAACVIAGALGATTLAGAQPYRPRPPPPPPPGWVGPHYYWHGHHYHHRAWAYDRYRRRYRRYW